MYQLEIRSKFRRYLLPILFLDHITSPSAVKLPVKKLVGLCRKYNVISVIDGAHAPGQFKLSMKDIGADFYSGITYDESL